MPASPWSSAGKRTINQNNEGTAHTQPQGQRGRDRAAGKRIAGPCGCLTVRTGYWDIILELERKRAASPQMSRYVFVRKRGVRVPRIRLGCQSVENTSPSTHENQVAFARFLVVLHGFRGIAS